MEMMKDDDDAAKYTQWKSRGGGGGSPKVILSGSATMEWQDGVQWKMASNAQSTVTSYQGGTDERWGGESKG